MDQDSNPLNRDNGGSTAADRSSRYTETLQRQISFDGLRWNYPRDPPQSHHLVSALIASAYMFNHLQESFNSDEPSCALSSTSSYHRHTFLASLYMFYPKCMRTEQLHPWAQIIGKSRAWSLRTQPGKTYQHTYILRITYEPLSECFILLTMNLSLLLYGACCIRFPATLQAFCLPGVFIAFAIVVPTITSHHGI